MERHVNPGLRHDFVYVFDVTSGNPNGDPDAGNLPRIDPETMHGLVTDVALKRKVRDYVDRTRGHEERYKIFVQSRVALNAYIERAYMESGIVLNERSLPAELAANLAARPLPKGLAVQDGRLVLVEELSDKEKRQAVDQVGKEFGDEAAALVQELLRNARDWAQAWMTANFYDIRMFGAVLSTGLNAGQVRGPLQLTFARSVDPIVPLDLAITRVAITTVEDKERKDTEMGRKPVVPYGLYVAYGFYNPYLGRQTGVTAEDLALFWEALMQMFEHDRSATRGLMACRGLYVFTHDDPKGCAPAHRLFERIQIRRRPEVAVPRSFRDYKVEVAKDLPEGITLAPLVHEAL